MASRNISDCCQALQKLIPQFKKLAAAEGIEVLIYCTYRSNYEQNKLYNIGRSLPGRKVTNCRGGASKHNCEENLRPSAKAFDCVPLINGKAAWYDNEAYNILGKIGKSLGLTWGGNFKAIDTPHFEIK
jgi:peptidoglycan L-alanyl-D-glutamate endopeptidase CwlK